MKEKLFKLFRRYKVAVFLVIGILFVSGSLLNLYLTSRIRMKYFENAFYQFSYDSSWTVVESKEEEVKLSHSHQATLTLQKISLEDTYKYQGIEEIATELTKQLTEKNTTYHLLAEENTLVTKNAYHGYQSLYESFKLQEHEKLHTPSFYAIIKDKNKVKNGEWNGKKT